MQAQIAAAPKEKVDRQDSQGRYPEFQSSKRELLSLLLGAREGRVSLLAEDEAPGLSGRLRGLGGPERGE